MIKANRQYFVVRIDKKLQNDKRNNLVSKNIGFLGIKHSKGEDDDKFQGVKVWDVEPNSPAYDATFKAGDIIKKIHGVPVNTYEEMAEQVSLYAPGAEITIDYVNSFSIDREHISTKKVILGERKFEIVLPPALVDFQFNLQFGEIIEMGRIASERFPEAAIGDLLIFHHGVEYKPRPEGDVNYNDYHLVDTDEETGDEYRIVNFVDELFGVWKAESGIIIPYHKFIFCRSAIKKATMQMNASGLWLPDGWETSKDELQAKIDEIKQQMEEITTSNILKERETEENYKRKAEINNILKLFRAEQKELTRKMNQKKLVEVTVLYIHPQTCDDLQTQISSGDTLVAEYNTLYPLDLFGVQYTLLRKEYVEAVIIKTNIDYGKAQKVHSSTR